MHADSTFTVASFEPVDYTSPIATAVPVGHAHMVKEFTGALTGRSSTQFSFAFDETTGAGTYVAMEAFEGSLAFAHTATTEGPGSPRVAELLVVVPGSGSGDLAGITGTGRISIDDAGTHAIELDYELTDPAS
jgi:hypothetical protein